MADKKGPEEESEGKGASARKKGVVLGGGIVGLVAAAYMLFLIAIPGGVGSAPFRGPYVIALTPEKVQVNLKGSGKHYLLMVLIGEYTAYEESYVTDRMQAHTFQAYMKDALLIVSRQKTKDDLEDTVGVESFKEEIRAVLNPLLFPVHIGDTFEQMEADSASGLRPGLSSAGASMRDGFRNHVLHLDAPRKTITLDDGPPIQFEGNETDLLVEDGKGRTIYLDLTEVEPSFFGDVNVGTFGTIREILFDDFVVQ